ncbi:ArsR/SmtB family transcription factor [Haladaptatus litoreus]|nr:metalloregulator ArsR/SmtB family transcription factor [Haladaptatus litoreus]
MTQTDERLRRLLTDELGGCCDSDVERRRDELLSLRETAFRPTDSDTNTENHVRVLSALANDTRYRIVRLLSIAEDDLCVCELAPLFDVSESALSHALSDLTDAGLVTRRKEGRWRYYGTTDRAERLLSALDMDDEKMDGGVADE